MPLNADLSVRIFVLLRLAVLCNQKDLMLSYRYTDMEAEDYSFYQGLEFLLTHDIKDLGYDLTFSTEVWQ